MSRNRAERAKKNIVTSLAGQLITLLCGLIIPRVMLDAFGSEIYGATTSITQFLAYITLLEGGIGGVARAALYEPLAQNDTQKISAIVTEVRRFFRIIAVVFIGYVIVLACYFKEISNIACMDWLSTFMLVIVISVSTIGQYFVGITYSVLLQAAQKSYVTNSISMVATVVNAIAVVALCHFRVNIIVVKLVSSCIYFMRPVCLWLFVKHDFTLIRKYRTKEVYLTQKWSGLGQHIAYFLHSNTDIAVLTCLTNLKIVSVYSVYNMVVTHIQSLTISFTSGMEAVFGDMLARREFKQLNQSFGYYETLISVVSVVLFATTAVLITPFVELYTAGITDAEYYAPVFAVLLVISALLYCLRLPYHSMVIAAGHFKQTSLAAYAEAGINIGVSVVLVSRFGLIGVAIGTVVATSFRFVYYAVYLSKYVFSRKVWLFLKRTAINAMSFLGACLWGYVFTNLFVISNFAEWTICGVAVGIGACLIVGILNLLGARHDCIALIKTFVKKDQGKQPYEKEMS